MSSFVIARKFQKTYWDDSGQCWTPHRKKATRYFWSWAYEIIDRRHLKENSQDDMIEVQSAPDVDMDFS